MEHKVNKITIVSSKEPHELAPGEMMSDEERRGGSKGSGLWYIGCPQCSHLAAVDPQRWKITLHEDGTITVSQSILHRSKLDSNRDDIELCGAHYFIERSKIRWV